MQIKVGSGRSRYDRADQGMVGQDKGMIGQDQGMVGQIKVWSGRSRYDRADQGMVGQKQIYETDINQENIADQGGFQERSGMVGGRGKI